MIMKLLKKFNPTMSIVTLATAVICVIDPTLITCSCCGFCAGAWMSDTIYNWNKR
jgi:hypothetical protein